MIKEDQAVNGNRSSNPNVERPLSYQVVNEGEAGLIGEKKEERHIHLKVAIYLKYFVMYVK